MEPQSGRQKIEGKTTGPEGRRAASGARLEAPGVVLLTHLVLGPGQHYLPQMRKLKLKKQGTAQESAAGSEPQKQLMDRARFLHVGFRKILGLTSTLLWPRAPHRHLQAGSVAQSPSCSPRSVSSWPLPPTIPPLCVFFQQQMLTSPLLIRASE